MTAEQEKILADLDARIREARGVLGDLDARIRASRAAVDRLLDQEVEKAIAERFGPILDREGKQLQAWCRANAQTAVEALHQDLEAEIGVMAGAAIIRYLRTLHGGATVDQIATQVTAARRRQAKRGQERRRSAFGPVVDDQLAANDQVRTVAESLDEDRVNGKKSEILRAHRAGT